MAFACEIRIRGRLSPAVKAEFAAQAQLTEVEQVETVLHGPVEDQAALHGILRLAEALGLEVTGLRRYPLIDPMSGAPPQDDVAAP